MMRKRLLSILLTACMVLSLMPTAAWAAGEPATAPGGSITDEASAKTAFGDGNVSVAEGVITLNGDVQAEDTLSFDFNSDDDWTLDLGRYTITGPDSHIALEVKEGAKLTLTSTGGGGVRSGDWWTAVEVSGRLTLEGAVTLEGGRNGKKAVSVQENGVLILGENAMPEFIGKSTEGGNAGWGLYCMNGSTLSIRDGAAPVCTGGWTDGVGLVLESGATVEGGFTGGTFTPGGAEYSQSILNDSGCSLLAPGYGFYKKDGGWVEESDNIAPAVEVKALGGDITAETTAGDVTNLFGGRAKLEDGTITLTDDVLPGAGLGFQSGTWTLDLNGHTLLGPGNVPALSVNNEGDLTLKGPGGVTGGGSNIGMGATAVNMGVDAANTIKFRQPHRQEHCSRGQACWRRGQMGMPNRRSGLRLKRASFYRIISPGGTGKRCGCPQFSFLEQTCPVGKGPVFSPAGRIGRPPACAGTRSTATPRLRN